MPDVNVLQRGRESFERRAWADACRMLDAADRESPLAPEDLDRLATAAFLIGLDDKSETRRARAHQAFLDRGDIEGAARSAFRLAFGLLHRGAFAPGSGWVVRAERLLADTQLECAVCGYLLIPAAIQRIVQGDPAAAHEVFSRAAEISSRFADRDLAALTCHGRGRALIRMGKVIEGVARLDEAMAAVVAGDVSPMFAGDVYCSVLEGCREIFDLRRAYEWTASLMQWCASQPDLVRYRGECLLYRAEVQQFRGHWVEAESDANSACALLSSGRGRPAAGAACYRVGEIHRLRGEFAQAETAYRRANEWGRQPQPGLSLLRLAQGQAEAAAASIRTALAGTRERGARATMLIAAVEIALAANDLNSARGSASELSEIARAIGAAFLFAASAHATGAVLLKAGEVEPASALLRQAWEGWCDLEMPYEEAQSRVLLAAACERLGDRDGLEIELDAARRLFARLNAAPALARLGSLDAAAPPQTPGSLTASESSAERATGASERSERATRAERGVRGPRERACKGVRGTKSPGEIGPLSDREAQVLRLVAAGKTNRAIAEELFISEKTVARHVSNIFAKLDVSSRAGATAWAYRQHLV